MTNLIESSTWESGVYQLETDDPTLGGPPGFNLGEPVTGHANAQAQQLVNRTKWLYDNKANNVFTQTGTGAVQRNVGDKIKDFITVKDFGVVGDGIEDDSVKFQAALTGNYSNGSSVITSVTGTGFSSLRVGDVLHIPGVGSTVDNSAKRFVILGISGDTIVVDRVLFGGGGSTAISVSPPTFSNINILA